MKKLILLSLVVLMAFSSVACKKKSAENVASEPAEKKVTFVVGLDDSFPPMGFRDENNVIVGFDVDLAREAAKRMGVELVLQPIDWASKELELNNNNIDAIWNGLSVDPARAEAMLLSKPYMENRMVILVKRDSKITKKDDLKGKNVGVQMGSTAVKALDKDPIAKEVKQVDYENNVLALSDLKIGRIDAVVADEIVARYLTAKEQNEFRILDESLDSEVYAIAFKKGNTQLADKVAKAMADMVADGTAEQISVKWFGSDIILK